jgi:hypothetical protein
MPAVSKIAAPSREDGPIQPPKRVVGRALLRWDLFNRGGPELRSEAGELARPTLEPFRKSNE